MQISTVSVGYMSPTGGVKHVALALESGFKQDKSLQNVSAFAFLSKRQLDVRYDFKPDDLVVFCFPVFFGRMPWVLKDWHSVQGHGAKAVVVAVYGNRACEDAPREFAALLKGNGFKVCGYAEVVAEHSMYRKLAAGRPDEQDKKDLAAMALQMLQAAREDALPVLDFGRSGPYRDYGKVPFVPETFNPELCRHCTVCSKICPLGELDPATHEVPEDKKELCMGCMACVSKCPQFNHGIPAEVETKIAAMMEKVMEANPERKPNKFVAGQY